MYQNIFILAAFVFLYSLVAGRLERTPINGAFVFAAFGLAFGPLGLGFLDLRIDAEGIRTIAELTLALVLFTDASNADLGVLKRSIRIPERLLLIGLPLTILLGFAAGVMIFDGLTLLEVAVLATLLAPTDAALGKAVVADSRVPANIRQGLNVESGLNDGICVPVLFVFLALAASTGHEGSPTILALELVAEEIGIGALVGIGLTLLGSWLFRLCSAQGWLTETWRLVLVSSLAVSCFAAAQTFGGSGFIASFVGGLLFGWMTRKHKHALLLAGEGIGDTLSLLTWVAFGAAVISRQAHTFSWDTLLYAVLSLTVIRMLPVVLVLAGAGLKTGEKLFIGWFGPRGLASIVFAVIVLGEDLPGGGIIVSTAALTIALSVIAHGVSANPLVARLSAQDADAPGGKRPESPR